MRAHCRPIVVLCATATMISGLSAGSVASAGQSAPTSESGVSAAAAAAPGNADTSTAPEAPRPAGICGTGFGPPVVDGIMSWKDPGLSTDVAGAADFVCPSPFTITQVDVMGYGGNPGPRQTSTSRCTANAPSNEPLNTAAAVCATQSVPGASGSTFPTSLQTTLLLGTPCTVPAGTYWVEVQMDDPFTPSTPWFWETQSTTGVAFDADWRDAHWQLRHAVYPGLRGRPVHAGLHLRRACWRA